MKMRVTMKQRFFLSVSVLLLCGTLQPGLLFGQTTIEGVTYKLDKGNYAPLGGVGVVAVRDNAGPASAHPVQSDSNGHFRLVVPVGDPIFILFYGDERVPQLQQLAGNSTSNIVHVTLYTPKEYKDRHPSGPSLQAKYRCLTEEVPKESEAAKILQSSIDKLEKY